jgi:L-lactate dehydrogenase
MATRIAIVGLGNVGASYAFALLFRGLASELVLIDANRGKAEGEAMDLNHAVPFTHSTRIWAGDYAECAGAAVTVITAGAAQKPGETRLDLAARNAAIFASIIPQVVKHNPGGILLIATNPVDVLSYVAWKLSGLPPERVLGSGTLLDTARFRYLLSEHFRVDARSVHGFIIGEHGDSEVPVWSLTNIAGMRLPEYAKHNADATCSPEEMNRIFVQTRDAGYDIIARKGSTSYGIAAAMVRITEAILRDQSTVLTVSSLVKGNYGLEDVYLSLPTVLHRGGVERVIHLELAADEAQKLLASAQVLRQTLARLALPKPA